MQRRHLSLIALIAPIPVSLGLPLAAHGQSHPTQPIRLVVPFPAAGATDLFKAGAAVFLAKSGICCENHHEI